MINNTKRIQPTNFLLAVQETNFLYSFTLSGFVAMSTTCTMLISNNFSDEKHGKLSIAMLVVSLIYCVYGVWISIFLYGRKVDHLKQRDLEEVEKAYNGVKYGLDELMVDSKGDDIEDIDED